MRKLFITFVFLLLYASCSSCSSHSSNDNDSAVNDADTLLNESDSIELEEDQTDLSPDEDTVCESYTGECEFEETTLCRSGSVYKCEHTLTDGCVTGHTYKLVESCSYWCEVEKSPSSGVPGVAKCGEYPDEDSPDYCPELTKIDFPLKDKDGSMTFCRPCDTRTDNDPDCISNLWKDSNERLCVDEPQYDCCGYPCEIFETLKPQTKKWVEENVSPFAVAYSGYSLDRCDILVNPVNSGGRWSSGHYTFKTFGMSEEKIVFEASNVKVDWEKYPSAARYFEFDIETLKYRILTGRALTNVAYSKGTLLASMGNIVNGEKDPDGMKYIIYRDSSGKLELVYPNQIWDFVLTPGLNEKWAFGSINEGNGEGSKIKYAEVGKWEWQELGEGTQYFQSIVGDKVTFFMDEFKGYQCDLSKSPKSFDDCILLNNGEESMRAPTMDVDDPSKTNFIYYTPVSNPDKFVRIDISKTPFEYKEFGYDLPAEYKNSLLGSEVVLIRGNHLLFHITYGPNYDNAERLKCYYRLDTQKTFCTEPVPWEYEEESGGQTDMGAADFEGHVLLWQDSIRALLKARDMECYCDWKPELCPFDDYVPNTEHPKINGFREERCEDKTNCPYTDVLD